ncbi:hypothetical protein [Sphaerisporangium flaviroseum]|uniref:hypothetical protein n=1 Tax=Sphaerisporangium flaviroseum TaxID=509199 RepID=UPI0031E640A2
MPCGVWELTLRSGKIVKFPDATVFPRTASGKVDKESSAPFAISGDGTQIVYFRKSDRKLVRKDVISGKVRSLPGGTSKVPKGLGMLDLEITLSSDGDVVVIDYLDSGDKKPTLAVDLRGGQVGKLPGADTVQGFSPDGRRILLSRFTGDNTTEFAVYDTDGEEAERREVPQVVSNNSPVALADDGVTVGVVIKPSSGKPRLRQYDLSTDAVSPAVDLPIRSDNMAYQIFWDESGKLTLWHLTVRGEGGGIVRATASTVNPSTGDLKKIDSFKVRTDPWIWWLPGE